MRVRLRISAVRVQTEADRLETLDVLRATYKDEKAWVKDVEAQFPPEDLARRDVSWFLVRRRGRPLGVLRVLYDPPIAQL